MEYNVEAPIVAIMPFSKQLLVIDEARLVTVFNIANGCKFPSPLLPRIHVHSS